MNLMTVLTTATDASAVPGSPANPFGAMDQTADFGAILAAVPVDGATSQPAVCVMPAIKSLSRSSIQDTASDPATAVPPGNFLPEVLPPEVGKPAIAIPIQRRLLSSKEALDGSDVPAEEAPREAALADAAPTLPQASAPVLMPTTVAAPLNAVPAADISRTDAPAGPAPRPSPPVALANAIATLPVFALPTADPRSPAPSAQRPIAHAAIGALTVDLVRDAEAPASSLISLPLGAPSNPPQPTLATAHIVPSAPHDFAALVDRLSAARDALQPQAVSIALSHGEFGAVRLQFRHEDGTLSVSMASADPDFARAVAAAPPIQPPAPTSDTAQTQQRGSESRNADAGAGQSRGNGHADRRDDRPARADPPQARGAHHGKGENSDIFA